MKRLSSVLAVGALIIPILAWGQGKTTKPPAAKPAPTVAELILQGKMVEAVRLVSKTPNLVGSTVQKLLDSADLKVSERQIAEAQGTLDNTEKFLDAYDKSRNRPSIPREPIKGRQMRLQGIKLIDAKEFAKAVTVLEEALETSKKTKDQSLEAGIHNNLGVALRSQNKLEEAKSEFEVAIRLAEEQKDAFRAGSCLLNLGQVQLQLKQFEPALESYKRSETQFKAASKTILEARAVLMQGVALDKINPVSPEALKFFDRARMMFEKAGDQLNTGWSFYLMGDHVAYSQKFAEAAAYGERAIPYLTAAADKDGLLRCYEFLADMYEKIDKKDLAAKYKKLVGEKAKS